MRRLYLLNCVLLPWTPTLVRLLIHLWLWLLAGNTFLLIWRRWPVGAKLLATPLLRLAQWLPWPMRPIIELAVRLVLGADDQTSTTTTCYGLSSPLYGNETEWDWIGHELELDLHLVLILLNHAKSYKHDYIHRSSKNSHGQYH